MYEYVKYVSCIMAQGAEWAALTCTAGCGPSKKDNSGATVVEARLNGDVDAVGICVATVAGTVCVNAPPEGVIVYGTPTVSTCNDEGRAVLTTTA